MGGCCWRLACAATAAASGGAWLLLGSECPQALRLRLGLKLVPRAHRLQSCAQAPKLQLGAERTKAPKLQLGAKCTKAPNLQLGAECTKAPKL